MRRFVLPFFLLSCSGLSSPILLPAAVAQEGKPAPGKTSTFRAGASSVDIAPGKFPVIVNGGFLQAQAARLNDPIRAKCVVLDDGTTRLAIAVVDSCMMPRELIDRAKDLAREKTGIPTERILISATHTHSAPSVMGALGTPPDADYAATLPPLIAESIERAVKNLEPARVGWAAVDDHEHTYCRRWIRRPDKLIEDPFGRKTVRANMHPGHQNPDAIAPSGPVDPALTVLSVQSRDGRPIAVLANYSMHYYGASPVSADYYGRFAAALARRIGAEDKAGRRHSSGSCRREPAAIRCGWITASPRRTRDWTLMPRPSPPRPSGLTAQSPIENGSRWRWPSRSWSSAAAFRTRHGWPGPALSLPQ